MKIGHIESLTVQVETAGQLDAIEQRFNCYTREGVAEAILEVDDLEPQDWAALREILGLASDDETPLPDSGYIHFWR